MARWTFYSAPGTCALATHIALHEAGADFDLVKLDFAAGQQQSPRVLARESQRPRAGAGHRAGRADRDPRPPRLCGAALSASQAGAAGRSLCLRADAGADELSGRDGPRGARAQAARCALGRRRRRARGHARQGPADDDGLRRVSGRPDCRPVGRGRGIQRGRRLLVHRRQLARRRRGRPGAISEADCLPGPCRCATGRVQRALADAR